MTKKKEERFNVIVYGTLRKGGRLNILLSGQEYMYSLKVNGYDMYTNGSYPAIMPGEGTIHTEVYNISKEVKEKIDWVELDAGYKAVEVYLNNNQKGIIYVGQKPMFNPEIMTWVKIDGDYIKHINE